MVFPAALLYNEHNRILKNSQEVIIMNIGEQIRTYRKSHNLTQEQVADALGVTAPAVNKWERAGSFPDITLLPALARLLEIDMNTLFSFHEELTEIEIAHFVNALYERALTGEIAEAFADAQEKIRDYPHCTPLLYTCATLLSASLTLSAVPPEGREKYNARIRDWFTRASESDDANYRTAACYQLAMLEITEGNYDRAEELVARLPDASFDKDMLQIRLLAHRGDHDGAALQTEAQVLAKIVMLHGHLQQLIEFETKTGHADKAQAIADVSSQLYALFALWPVDQVSPQLVAALHREDAPAALSHIRSIFDVLRTPWNGDDSPLFYRLAEAGKLPGVEPAFTSAFIRELETQPEYDFLRDDAEFQQLLADAREMVQ